MSASRRETRRDGEREREGEKKREVWQEKRRERSGRSGKGERIGERIGETGKREEGERRRRRWRWRRRGGGRASESERESVGEGERGAVEGASERKRERECGGCQGVEREVGAEANRLHRRSAPNNDSRPRSVAREPRSREHLSVSLSLCSRQHTCVSSRVCTCEPGGRESVTERGSQCTWNRTHEGADSPTTQPPPSSASNRLPPRL